MDLDKRTMTRISDIDARRRQLLLALVATGVSIPLSGAQLSRVPGKLQPGQFFYRFSGEVKRNGTDVTLDTTLAAGDIVTTGEKSFVIFVFEQDAFILRSSSEMVVRPKEAPIPASQEKPAASKRASKIPSAYSLRRGKVLSVMASRTTQISTPSAVVAIRGTGVYVEAEPEESYVCVCYGETEIESSIDPAIRETVITQHHDAPKYVKGGANPQILPAPFKNHDDQELLLIETLVGRTTPYFVPGGIPRSRNNYF